MSTAKSRNSSTTTTRETQPSVTIPTMLRSRSTAAQNVPIVAGMCVPQTYLTDVARGHVSGFETPVAARFEVLNRWNDGSVRWMLGSFVAPEVSSTGQELSVVVTAADHSSESPASDSLTTVKCIQGEISITTRDLTCDPPTQRTVRLYPALSDTDGKDLLFHFDSIREEVAGPIRQVYLVAARIQSMPFVTLQLRLTNWESTGLLHVETRIRNTRRAKHAGGLWDLGDAGSFFFRSLEVVVCSDEIPATAATHWKAERDHSIHSTSSEILLRQFSSGGRIWNGTNRFTASEHNAVQARGYELKIDSKRTGGTRAEPTILVEGDSAYLAVAVPEFWQQFPGSVATEMGTGPL